MDGVLFDDEKLRQLSNWDISSHMILGYRTRFTSNYAIIINKTVLSIESHILIDLSARIQDLMMVSMNESRD